MINFLICIVEKKESKINNGLKFFKHIGNFIVSLVTIAASIATCFTLWEMRNERNQSYKPYFVIETVKYMDEYTKPVFNIRDVRNLGNSLLVDVEKIPRMYIIANNIGAGTATNIDVLFSDEEYENYWAAACEYYTDDEIDISDDEIKYNLDSNEPKIKGSHYMKRHDLNVYKSYIVPGATMEIPLPEEYCTLFRSIAYCTNGDCYKLPKIKLTINYDDLQGIHYAETYNINVDIKVDLDSSDTMDYANYIIEQCR